MTTFTADEMDTVQKLWANVRMINDDVIKLLAQREQGADVAEQLTVRRRDLSNAVIVQLLGVLMDICHDGTSVSDDFTTMHELRNQHVDFTPELINSHGRDAVPVLMLYCARSTSLSWHIASSPARENWQRFVAAYYYKLPI